MKTLPQIIREQIESTLKSVDGNRTQAAILLGISYYSLLRKLKKYGYPTGRSGKPKAKAEAPE